MLTPRSPGAGLLFLQLEGSLRVGFEDFNFLAIVFGVIKCFDGLFEITSYPFATHGGDG